MASNFLGVILLIVIICNVCPIYCEYSEGNPHQSYDMAKLIQHASTKLGTHKNLNKLINDHGISLFDEFKSFTAENLYPFFIDILSSNVSDKCVKDLLYVFENAKSQFSLQMFDSFGKPERGLKELNLRWMGEFDECISVFAPSNGTAGGFHGQYCNLQVTPTVYGMGVPITIGACLPDSCDPPADLLNITIISEIVNITNIILKPYTNITELKLTCNPVIKTLTPAAIGVIFLLSIFILLALIGSSITAYEHFANIGTSRQVVSASGFEQRKTSSTNGDIDRQSLHGDDDVQILGYTRKNRKLPSWVEKINPFFNCFCFFTNGAKLLDTSNSEGQLPCLHGIRFLSLSWVIVCHTYAFVISYTREMMNILPAVDHWPFQIIMNGFYSVDSFFLLSGFLLAYLFFEVASKNNGKVPWVYFYVHRYVRLTPVYMIVLAFYTTIYPYLSSGPLWTTHAIDPNCHKNWWKNLLYINNFSDSTEMVQGVRGLLYITSMAAALTIKNSIMFIDQFPAVGVAILAFFMNATTFINFVISYQYELVAGLGNIFVQAQPQNFMQGVWMDYFNKVYLKPYTRISPYLVGISLAYYLYRRRQSNCGKNSLMVLSGGWLIASTVTLTCLFGLFHAKMSVFEMSLYNAFNRTCFALGLAWVIYVCLTGQGGFINSILSFKLFIPLSRLTYCAYLVHPIVMYIYYASMRSLLDFSHIKMVILYMGFLVMSYGMAFITSLLFESPVIRLDKLVRNKLGGK